MKAATRREYGSPDQIIIEDLEKPIPKNNEVLVRVYYTTVNRTDCANLTASPFIMRFVLGFLSPRKKTLGTDFSGEVISIGAAVKNINVGDRVFGFNDIGAMSQAEYLVLTTEHLFAIPDDIDYKKAVASLEGAHYAYTFIHKVNILKGQNILINGATGAIGSALLQFVRQYDVRITATCNTDNVQLIESLGANKVIDYTKESFIEGNEKYDFIFDAVGKSTFGQCKSILCKRGVYISSELGPYSQNLFYALFTKLTSKKVIFPVPFNKRKTIPFITEYLVSKKIMPVVDREYRLNDISKAYKYVMNGQKIGNVIICLRDE